MLFCSMLTLLSVMHGFVFNMLPGTSVCQPCAKWSVTHTNQVERNGNNHNNDDDEMNNKIIMPIQQSGLGSGEYTRSGCACMTGGLW